MLFLNVGQRSNCIVSRSPTQNHNVLWTRWVNTTPRAMAVSSHQMLRGCACIYIFSPVWPEKEPAFSHLLIVSGTASSYLSELLHLFSLSCSLCSEGILGSSVFIGWAEGPWGRDPFNTSDLWSGTLFLSLSGICVHSLKSKLKTHHFSPAYCSVVFFSVYQPKVQHNLWAVFSQCTNPKCSITS